MSILLTAKLRDILGDFNHIWASEGLCSATVNLVRVAGQRLFFRGDCFLYARSLEEPISIVKSINGLFFREAQIGDLHLFEAMKVPSHVLWYKMLLEKERVCVVASKDNQLAAYGWFTSEVDPVVERTYVPLAQDEIFVFDLFTMPTFRCQGIQSALFQQMLQLARKRGYKRALSLVMVDNLPSLNLHDKLGFQVISRFTKVRVLGLVRFYFRPNLFGKAGDVVRWL
jgi:ribosomal protein S18 acetylase RimI-like enzyme